MFGLLGARKKRGIIFLAYFSHLKRIFSFSRKRFFGKFFYFSWDGEVLYVLTFFWGFFFFSGERGPSRLGPLFSFFVL